MSTLAVKIHLYLVEDQFKRILKLKYLDIISVPSLHDESLPWRIAPL